MEPNPIAQDSIQPPTPIQQPIESNFLPVKKSLPKWPLLVVGVILLATLLTGTFVLTKNLKLNQKPTTETMTKTPNHTLTASSNQAPTGNTMQTNLTANWKTYASKLEGLSIKYPSNWTLIPAFNDRDPNFPIEGFTLTSPTGFVITYTYPVSGLDGGCDPAQCPIFTTYNNTTVNILNYKIVYLTHTGTRQVDSALETKDIGLTDKQKVVGTQHGLFVDGLFYDDKNSPNKGLVRLSGTYPEDSTYQKLSAQDYFKLPDVATGDKILETVTYNQTYQTAQTTPTPTTTPDITANWSKYSDSKYNYSFKFPTNWTTQTKDYPENNQRLINIIKNSSPSVVSLSFTISNSWANTGAQDQPKNYSVGGTPALRVDPPTKAEKQLDRYQTNVYFENNGNIYTFVCTHNWDQNYIDTCNNILSTFKFTK